MREMNFTSLTPETREANEHVYNQALDEAINNDSIKNIAITGIYGAGKSTVWETYKKERGLNNIITVSLGKYDNEFIDENRGKLSSEESNYKREEVENSIERQLINQVVAQIDNKAIPLSKYQYKENKSFLKSIIEVILSLSFVLSILFWIYREELLLKIQNEIVEKGLPLIVLFLFLLPIAYVVFGLTKRKKLHFLKVKLGTTEASLQEDLNSDETILDRDIRELVYVLYNSKSNIVVFEDLDRYDYLEIYKKLRELNLLVNYFITSKNDKRIVKFVYLLRDGLFYSKNRTKFFDFIIPIIPIVDSRNSENKILELFEGAGNSPSKRIITNISLYIDDMRLLKNIYNEYNIYFNIIAMKQLELKKDKLFSLIVLKNVFPKEFDSLQQDRGYIYNLIQKKEILKKELKQQKEEELNEFNNRINFLNEEVYKSKFDLMTKYILTDIYSNQNNLNTWSEMLREWHQNPNETKEIIHYKQNVGYYQTDRPTYEEFLQKYIYRNEGIKKEIDLYPVDKKEELEKLHVKKNEMQERLKAIDLLNLSQVLKKMSITDRERVYSDTDSNIKDSHYFALIKYLIYEGLIDEAYWHYKGYFYNNSVGKNDTLFLKNILEGNDQDVFLKLENPREVINRMNDDDFLRNNILNIELLQQCLLDNSSVKISNMLYTIVRYDNIESLINVLVDYCKRNKISLLNKFVEITFSNDAEILCETIKSIGKYNTKLFRLLVVSLYSQEELTGDIDVFKNIIESESEVLLLLQNNRQDIFFENLSKYKIKFSKLPCEPVSPRALQEIINKGLYNLNISNIHYLVSNILDQKEVESVLLNYIFKKDKLVPIKRQIELNFEVIIKEYIESYKNVVFSNNEDIIIKILNSEVDEFAKKQYLDSNSVNVTDLSELQNFEEQIENGIVDKIFETGNLKFSIDNISFYFDNGGEITEEFLMYVEKNHQNKFSNELENSVVKQSKILCNKLLSYGEIYDGLFVDALSGADTPISNLHGNYPENRIIQIISKGFLEINDNNINYLLENNYIDSLVLLYNSFDFDITEIILSNIEDQVDLEEIIKLINNVNRQDAVLKLISELEININLSQISSEKEEIISYVLDSNLSYENIEYVLLNFETFPLKDQFLKRIQEKNNFDKLKFHMLNDNFFNFALQSDSLSEDNKLLLIEQLINNSERYQDILKYLKLMEEGDELVSVFDGRRPIIDTGIKKRIASFLEEKGYVKNRNDGRIMLAKKFSREK
ncbi:YobI family P-loop NTPase [Staphylococcus americanisciuri]|uniref:YobI-like P-loop NTPase domain-containing protein n=1 Tax=Staphylococcus americanisciuri TaxID=2973940 RepID=A0ABT2F0E7_9STAP|nr:hypothetical protein [Staphylococcus americanisciuri]MCS4485901.1 hypothetical protein [Staphylococcus americanisciuri]